MKATKYLVTCSRNPNHVFISRGMPVRCPKCRAETATITGKPVSGKRQEKMKNSELIEKLKRLPLDAEVHVHCPDADDEPKPELLEDGTIQI